MSRRLLIAAVAPILGAALIAPAAASADPTTPGPTGTASPGATGTASPGPTATMTTPPAPSPATDTATVCKNVGITLKGGWPPVQSTLEQAQTQLSQHDLNGTEASLKQAGQRLTALGVQVKQDASQASDANLKTTVTTLGTQLTELGSSLNNLNSLKSFDPGKLAPTGKQLSSICKGNLDGAPLPG